MATYLIKLGELTLKGGNIRAFEKRLIKNAQMYLQNTKAQVFLRAGRMYIDCPDESCSIVEYALEHLIGISGWAKSRICEKTIESIKAAVMAEALAAKQGGSKTFKLEARRSEKTFPLTSYEICKEAASDVFDQGILKVDVHEPDLTIRIELRERCFVYSDKHRGRRGLPVGTGGKGLLLLSGGIDSPVAGYLMLSRGMRIECIYFHAHPYTSIEAQKKVENLARILARYGLEIHLNIVHFTDVQMRIRQKGPEDWTTLLLRFCMVKTANLLARHIQAQCLISGESLGQVASQTIENMSITGAMADLPLLRPLVGLDKEEIIAKAQNIGTYETSILPYEDCCVLFTPKHPVLRGRIQEAEKFYTALDCGDLIEKAFESREIKLFTAYDTNALL